ncbi:MAG: pH regulation protein F [Candidatus Rokubacteria bacterium]|nr:pH regulation protein F [Candidatus Rokubacteria bacterium]MBI2878654.1 pH regulation protein F [Candidatus Rokubacteria bacterium]
MRTVFVAAAACLIVLTLGYLYRLVTGPTIFDRILGLSGFGTSTTIILTLMGCAYGRLDMFVDIALGYALLNFVGVLAAARYFERARG